MRKFNVTMVDVNDAQFKVDVWGMDIEDAGTKAEFLVAGAKTVSVDGVQEWNKEREEDYFRYDARNWEYVEDDLERSEMNAIFGDFDDYDYNYNEDRDI